METKSKTLEEILESIDAFTDDEGSNFHWRNWLENETSSDVSYALPYVAKQLVMQAYEAGKESSVSVDAVVSEINAIKEKFYFNLSNSNKYMNAQGLETFLTLLVNRIVDRFNGMDKNDVPTMYVFSPTSISNVDFDDDFDDEDFDEEDTFESGWDDAASTPDAWYLEAHDGKKYRIGDRIDGMEIVALSDDAFIVEQGNSLKRIDIDDPFYFAPISYEEAVDAVFSVIYQGDYGTSDRCRKTAERFVNNIIEFSDRFKKDKE